MPNNKYVTFHYHLTLENVSVANLTYLADRLNCKATAIDLVDGIDSLVLKDRMLTKHFRALPQLNADLNRTVSFLNELDIKVVRKKVEQQFHSYDLFYAAIKEISAESNVPVCEIHKKVSIGEINFLKQMTVGTELMRFSSNPVQKKRFVNVKFNSLSTFHRATNLIESLMSMTGENGYHFEIVVRDSNSNHDSKWWKTKND